MAPKKQQTKNIDITDYFITAKSRRVMILKGVGMSCKVVMLKFLVSHRLFYSSSSTRIIQYESSNEQMIKRNDNLPANLFDDGDGEGKLGKLGVSNSFFNGVD